MSSTGFPIERGGSLEKLLSAEELAEILGVPLGTVYRWNYAGGGPPVLKIGRHAKYRPADVERYLEEKAKASARPA
jgi:excisionase family DNA binding protein